MTSPLAEASRASRSFLLTRLLLFAGLAAFGLALAAFFFVCYRFPDGYDSYFFPLNPFGMHEFRTHLGLSGLTAWNYKTFSRALRLALILLWGGYGLAVYACLRGARPSLPLLSIAVVAAAIITAFFMPPLFSSDVYANVAHGRIFVLYGQNPYLWKPSGLTAYHDPIVPFLAWDWPTIYGPVWTWLEIGVTAATRSAGVWGEVVGQKLLLACALVTAAFAGRRLAARFSPGLENLTFLAIGLNPLLLIEGPGNGHNDLACLSLLLVGAVLYFEKKYAAAALLLGLSVGIKPITLAVLPWVLMDDCRGRPLQQALTRAASGTALVLLPTALFFAPLWAGPATLAAMHQRAAFGQGHNAAVRGLLAIIYLGLTAWLWKGRMAGGWLLASAVFSVALMFLFLVPHFPWYIAWFCPIFLLRWSRWSLALSTACLALSFYSLMTYAMLTQTRPDPVHMWINMDGTKSAQREP